MSTAIFRGDYRLTATGQHLCAERAVIECRFTKAPEPCPKCGAAGVSRGTVDRHLAHTPYGQRSTRLLLRIRRWRCVCGCFWHEDTSSAAPPRSKLSHGAIRWALAAIVLDDLSVSRVASHLDVAWHTANSAIIQRLLFNDPKRFDGVTVLGVSATCLTPTKSNCSSCLQMSTTSKWIAPGTCTNGWSAPTTSRIEGVVKNSCKSL